MYKLKCYIIINRSVYMRYPKPLSIQLPKTDYPIAIKLPSPPSTPRTPESDKDFEIGELYIPSEKDVTKLSPRRDVSPSIFNVTRIQRRNHPSNFEQVVPVHKPENAPSTNIYNKTFPMRFPLRDRHKKGIGSSRLRY